MPRLMGFSVLFRKISDIGVEIIYFLFQLNYVIARASIFEFTLAS
jgi:hypothetical protein